MKVVLLHALPFDERMWERQLPELGGHDVQAPTLYGLGDDIDEWALEVLRLVPGRFVAVGASMGGYCAAAIARLAPERLVGLVLAGSRADADPPERRPLREQWIQIVRDQGAEGFWTTVARTFFSDAADPAVVERGHAIVAEQRPDDLVQAIEAIRDRSDSTEAVTGGIPLLAVSGEDDGLIPSQLGRDLAASSPNGRAEVVERCGHLPAMERPAAFNRILTTFLESL